MQLGADTRTEIYPQTPASFKLPENSSAIFMSNYHAIALAESGRTFFWGSCLQKNYGEQTKDGIQATPGEIDQVKALSIQIFDDNIFPDVYLKDDGVVWLAHAPLPKNTDQCQTNFHLRRKQEFDHSQFLSGIPFPVIAIATGGDGTAPYPILAVGKDNSLWGANFRYPEKGFEHLNVKISNNQED